MGQLGKLGNLKSVQTSLQKKISESPLKKLRLLGNLTEFQMRHELILFGTTSNCSINPASLVADSLGCKAFFCLQKNSTAFSNFNGSSGSSGSSSKTSTSTATSYISFYMNPTNALPPCANSSCNWERLGILQGKSTKFGQLFSGTFSATCRWLETTNSPALDERCRQS